jgi:hypothetical protein
MFQLPFEANSGASSGSIACGQHLEEKRRIPHETASYF